MAHRGPRIVIVTRKSPLELLVERRGTMDQARFYLRSRQEDVAPYQRQHEAFHAALRTVAAALPADQRRARVDREDLPSFLFAPDDVVVIVGQDGLVPNVAKYLSGQLVLGINPDPGYYDGVLCRHAPEKTWELLAWLQRQEAGAFRIERRVMAVAQREDGQRLRALNEVFVGHRTHQSARYRIRWGRKEERQSSSGIICATGTGSTGWARSIAQQRKIKELPRPQDRWLAWFVREPFPSVATGTSLDFGKVMPGVPLEIVSEMSEGGVLFADGIEGDRVEFASGQAVRLMLDEHTLRLVVPAAFPAPATKQPRTSAAERPARPQRPRRRTTADTFKD